MKKLRSIILLFIAGLAIVGMSLAAPAPVTVSTTGTVPSVMSFTAPNGGTMPSLNPSSTQPITLGDSFSVSCNGPFAVNAVTAADFPLAANGKMVEWDPLSLHPLNLNPDGHILGNAMELKGTGSPNIGDHTFQAINVKLVESAGCGPTTYTFNWAQNVLWSDYPETPYKIYVTFSLNPVIT